MKTYILKNGDYYLEDYLIEDIYDSDINIFNWRLKEFKLSKDVKKLFYDFDEAEDIRKLIFIESGYNLEVKRFRSNEELDIEEDL
jgi:hypothetical protein